MKALITADFHLTSRTNDWYRWEIFPILQRIAHEEPLDCIFILGDITDKKDKHDSHLVNRLIDWFGILAKEVPIYILRGNHDYVDANAPFFRFLRHMKNLTYINEAEIIKISDDKILLVPHTKNFIEEWKPFKREKVDYIFLHQTFSGSRVENGYVVEGVDPSVISRDHPSSQAISGDIHVPQVVKEIIYCGAPHPINFGDGFEPRVLIIDGEDIDAIEIPSIRKLHLKINKPEDVENYRLSKDDQVKITLKLLRSQFGSWDEYKNTIMTYLDKEGVQICGIELEEKVRRRLGQKASQPTEVKIRTPDDVLVNFCLAHDIEEPLLKLGMVIIDEVSGEV